MAEQEEPIHKTWIHRDTYVHGRFVRPAMQFLDTEASGGIVLLVAAVVALIWANSPWGDSYFAFWNTEVHIEIGDFFHFEETLKEIVNDGLMAIFFFVVGMEIKRELVVGELNEPRKAAMPVMAAVGGMVVPALIYVGIVASNGGGEATQGWGIPMATDIAFSVGVVALLGTRVSVGAKLFLLALAIVDDIGAILVIAIFYTEQLAGSWMVVAAVGFGALWLAKRAGIRSTLFYVILGVIIWFAFLESGVHATIAGVLLGLMTPVLPLYSEDDFHRKSEWILEGYDREAHAPRSRERLDHLALQLAAVSRESVSPLDRLEGALHNFTSFFVVPVFALANAGVSFAGLDLVETVSAPVSLGVIFGLILGKPIGITVATWLGLRLGLGKLPRRTDMRHIVGLGFLAGIGFTVSLFIAELAFTDEILTDEAKIGIFIGSAVAGVVGYLILRAMKTPQEALEEARDAMPVPTTE